MSKNPYHLYVELSDRINKLERIKNPTSYQVNTLKRLRKEIANIIAIL